MRNHRFCALAGLTALFFLVAVYGLPAIAEEMNPPASAMPPTSEADLAEGSVMLKPYPVIFEAKQKAVLSAKRAGVLTLLKYEVGEDVKKGNTIAKVDPGEPALLKKRATSQLTHLQTRVSELARLNQQGLATNKELADAKMELDVVRTNINIYERQISDSYIRAPFTGRIIRRHVKAHEWVTDGQPVVDLVDLSAIRAVADIAADVAVTLKKGDVHSFYVPDLAAEVDGSVLAVSPEVDERSNTARVIWEIKKGDLALLPGMKGDVRIEQ